MYVVNMRHGEQRIYVSLYVKKLDEFKLLSEEMVPFVDQRILGILEKYKVDYKVVDGTIKINNSQANLVKVNKTFSLLSLRLMKNCKRLWQLIQQPISI